MVYNFKYSFFLNFNMKIYVYYYSIIGFSLYGSALTSQRIRQCCKQNFQKKYDENAMGSFLIPIAPDTNESLHLCSMNYTVYPYLDLIYGRNSWLKSPILETALMHFVI